MRLRGTGGRGRKGTRGIGAKAPFGGAPLDVPSKEPDFAFRRGTGGGGMSSAEAETRVCVIGRCAAGATRELSDSKAVDCSEGVGSDGTAVERGETSSLIEGGRLLRRDLPSSEGTVKLLRTAPHQASMRANAPLFFLG